ncbi:S9 family peptidase [Qipengyuania sp. JC766]|uniref:S9 family peptidase n=1 Tax=Qipengyuania sp. JC766 TaxID=3232139 RepID=UPI003457FE44
MRKTAGLTATIAAVLAAMPAFAQSETARPMEAEDLITMPRLGAPVVTRDGRYVVYAVTNTDPQSYDRTRAYFLQNLNEADSKPVPLALPSDARSLEFGAGLDLYFLSNGSTQSDGSAGPVRVWRVTPNASGRIGAPVLVGAPGGSVDGFKLSPSGDRIALFGEFPRECTDIACAGEDSGDMETVGTGRLYDADEGFVRHWDQWKTPGHYNRVFVYDVTPNGLANPMPADARIMGGAFSGDTPTKPFGGPEDIAWSPSGQNLWFVARQSGADEPLSTNLDIWQLDTTTGIASNVTEANAATDAAPTPSPDGRYLAYLAMARPGYEADRMVVQLRDLQTGEVRPLTQRFDRSFGSLAWTRDSRYLIATAQSVLDTPAYRIDPRSGEVTELDLMAGNEAHIGNVMPLAGDRLLFTQDSIGAPPELFLSTNFEQAMPVSMIAKSRVGELASVVTRRFSFAGANGDTVWGQITKLEDFDGEMPAILYVHGGPQGSFNDGWSTRWNPRVLASQGYAVISVDFHGSTGYGQAFTDSINRDWGGKPLEDLQKGLAAALALDSQIDGERACAMGASYGGYMMNWIAGNWPDRFDCLVQHDGLFDMRSFYYTTEELWFPRWDFGGSYAAQKETYEKWNPVNHVHKWKTPMLVITGEKDFRVPYTQGLASFTALQQQSVPAQLLVFPDENHWVLGAENSLQWHRTVFAWLDRWLNRDGAAAVDE